MGFVGGGGNIAIATALLPSSFAVSLWNDLANPVFDGVGLAGFKSSQCFFISLSCSIPTIVFYSLSLSLLSDYRLVLWGWDLRSDRVYITLSLSLALPTFFYNNKVIITRKMRILCL